MHSLPALGHANVHETAEVKKRENNSLQKEGVGTTQPTAGLQKKLKFNALPQKWLISGVTFHSAFEN